MAEKPKISEAEWEVMKIVWAKPASNAKQIVDELGEKKSWNHRTVKTLLSRLVKKGALSFETDGNRYLYKANFEKDDIVQVESQSFVNRVFDGLALPMLAHFVSSSKMSQEEIQELKRILEAKEQGGDDDSAD